MFGYHVYSLTVGEGVIMQTATAVCVHTSFRAGKNSLNCHSHHEYTDKCIHEPHTQLMIQLAPPGTLGGQLEQPDHLVDIFFSVFTSRKCGCSTIMVIVD